MTVTFRHKFYFNFFKYVSSDVSASAFNIRLISLIILPIVSAIWKKSGVVHHTFPSLTAFISARILLYPVKSLRVDGFPPKFHT